MHKLKPGFVKLSVPTLLLSFIETPSEIKSPPTTVTISPFLLQKKLYFFKLENY